MQKILCIIQTKVEETGFLLENRVADYIEVTSGRTKFQAGEQVELFCHTSYYGREDLAICRKDTITPVITITSGNTVLAGKYFYFSMPDFDSDLVLTNHSGGSITN